jgi:nitric oxide dioxygenase|tara:strand:- start:505 stop:741 length:237 start_codon:yes stop_codon:yes gene_type:complete
LTKDLDNQNFDTSSLVNETVIRDGTPFAQAEFYFSGPKPFIQNAYAIPMFLNVSAELIHFEFFGLRHDIESTQPIGET